ncbi:ENDUC protein, partial [Neopipo cinnamomea]|nr:ENDUC protein [Neopipo cinnamomea]
TWLLLVLLVTPGGVLPAPRGSPETLSGVSDPEPRGGPEPRSAVSDRELRDLSEQLLAADSNRAGPGQLELNLQSPEGDPGSQRLFSYVSPALLSRPTFSRLLALLDNYEPQTGRAEEVTAEEQQEERQFLEAALDTPVLALLENFVLRKGGARGSLRPQNAVVGDQTLGWNVVEGCPGWGHCGHPLCVFPGEVKKGSVSGCHNWVQLQALERAGRMEYLGYTWDGP